MNWLIPLSILLILNQIQCQTPGSMIDIGVLKASDTFNFEISATEGSRNITVPANYVIYIEKLVSGLTFPSSSSCTSQPLSLRMPCTLSVSCEYTVPRRFPADPKCSQTANSVFIYGEYRHVPFLSDTKFSMGDTSVINVDRNQYGVFHSENYPTWEEFSNSTIRLVTTHNKAIKVIVTHIDIEEGSRRKCQDYAYLEVDDGVISPQRFCGFSLYTDKHEFTSCSQEVVLNYRTGKDDGLSFTYRGFNAYYELVDIPSACKDIKQVIECAEPKPAPPPAKNHTEKILTESLLIQLGYTHEATRINLNGYDLEHIEPNAFKNFKSLQYLDLSQNKLSELKDSTFNGLVSLNRLSLESNLIGSIEKNSFKQLTELKTVCMKNNPVSVELEATSRRFVCQDRSDCNVLTSQTCCDEKTCNIP